MERLMIVDDEAPIVRSLQGYLSECFDLEIHCAYSAREAMQLMRRMRMDIVITDISMPQMSGLELMEVIRKTWPRCRVIMLTAYQTFDYAYQAIRQQHVDYILKIESYELIRDTVQKRLEEIRRERAEEQRLITLDQRASHASKALLEWMIRRAVHWGDPLPPQEELDEMQIALKAQQPVLLAVGHIGPAALRQTQGLFEEMDAYLRHGLAQRGMVATLLREEENAIWLIQPMEGVPEDEEAVGAEPAYVQDLLETLPKRVQQGTGHTVTIILAEDFVPWHRLPNVFADAITGIERFRNENGLILLGAVVSPAEQNARAFPEMDALQHLWELLRQENTQHFLDVLAEGLAFLDQVTDLPGALPLPAVSAYAFLCMEAARLYALEIDTENQEGRLSPRRLFHCVGYKEGSAWKKDALDYIQQLLARRNSVQEDRSKWVVKQINEYVEAHYEQDLTLSSLAEQVHYNPSYLARIYKQQTGESVMTYVTRVRIAAAKQYLLKTTLKTGDIAKLCGFYTPKYFNKVFQRETGVSASQFRQSK